MLRWLVIAAVVGGCRNNEDVPPPVISTISPDHAPPGSIISIAGDFFCQQPETEESDPFACMNVGVIEFGLVPGTITSYTDHAAGCEVPAIAAGKVGVSLNVRGRHSSSIEFVVEAP